MYSAAGFDDFIYVGFRVNFGSLEFTVFERIEEGEFDSVVKVSVIGKRCVFDVVIAVGNVSFGGLLSETVVKILNSSSSASTSNNCEVDY